MLVSVLQRMMNYHIVYKLFVEASLYMDIDTFELI